MSDRRVSDNWDGAIRPELGRPGAPRGSGAAAPADVRRGFVPRWPDPGRLAALLIDGVVKLPRGYRRGFFLDIFV